MYKRRIVKRKEFLKEISKIKRSSGNIIHTFTTDYLLQTIDLSIESFNENFINTHLKYSNNLPQLVIIFENDNDKIYQNLTKCRINSNYIRDYEDEDEYIVEFNVPPRYYDIIRLFINGEYSKFNNDYKNKLTKIYGKGVCEEGKLVTMYDTIYPRKDKIKQIADILGVSPDILPNGEVYDKPDLSYEIFKDLRQLQNTDHNTNTINEQRAADTISDNNF